MGHTFLPCQAIVLLLLSLVGLSCTREEPTFRAAPLDDFSAPFYFGEFRVPRDNPLTKAGVELGRALFYETQLSTDGTVSCGFCHQQEKAFTDGKPLAVGVTGVPTFVADGFGVVGAQPYEALEALMARVGVAKLSPS